MLIAAAVETLNLTSIKVYVVLVLTFFKGH